MAIVKVRDKNGRKIKRAKRRAGIGAMIGRFFGDLLRTFKEAVTEHRGQTGGGGGGGGGGASAPTSLRPSPWQVDRATPAGRRADGTVVGFRGSAGRAVHGQGGGFAAFRKDRPDLFADEELDELEELDKDEAAELAEVEDATEATEDVGDATADGGGDVADSGDAGGGEGE